MSSTEEGDNSAGETAGTRPDSAVETLLSSTSSQFNMEEW